MATEWRWGPKLADLVLAGIKRSTTNFALLAASLPILTPRRFRHMLDGEGHPRFILANQRVTPKPLSQVGEAFA